jgi:hypothetical protein
LEKITMGSVEAPGPVTKLAITRSSSDSVKASSQPAISAGAITGSVMSKKTRTGRAPRSIAASSSELSMPESRDCTTTATKAMQKVTWAMVTVVMPRPAGQPISCSIDTNKQQQRQAGDDFRHDQRRRHHAGQQRPRLEAAEAHQHEGRQRAERDRDGGAEEGDLQADPGRPQGSACRGSVRHTSASKTRPRR